MKRGPRRKRPVLEATTENKSVDYACGRKENLGCVHYKLNGLGKMAKPDQLIVTPNGYDWFVEFKREGEGPTKLQELEAEALIERHQLHSFIWSFEEFKFKLQWILKLPPRGLPPQW
jgi:hypothetical protein